MLLTAVGVAQRFSEAAAGTELLGLGLFVTVVTAVTNRPMVILRKKRENLREAFDLLASMPEDYFAEERRGLPPEIREAL